LDITPQERLALVVLTLLLTGGGLARLVADPSVRTAPVAERSEWDDTSGAATLPALRAAAERERELARIRTLPLAAGERIDPNSAPAEQLARLPRIGPALAARVVEDREARGPFRTVDELERVAGIGPAVMGGIREHLEVSGVPGWSTEPARSAGVGDERLIDINRASAAELEALPGIGPVLAERIVAHRARNGRFASVADLENVSGIGPALRSRLEPRVRVGP
jgi:competence ComEA-like helix-hairpin-helix protein